MVYAISSNPIGVSITFDSNMFKEKPWNVVLGDPGSGKSISLKKFLLDYIEQASDHSHVQYSGIPIVIPLREFAHEHDVKGQGYSLLDFINDYAKGMLSVSCSRGFFEHFLEAGECLVCFDGLDEVVVAGQRRIVRDIVIGFTRRYPRNRYLITSRIVGYDEAPLSTRLFPHYIVQSLSDQVINLYVLKWYRTRENSQSQAENRANELFETIMKSERLHDLASSPLLLAIIALIHRKEAELPHERVKLYDKCSEALLTTFESVKRLERVDYDKEYYRSRREILEAVAFWMQAAEWDAQEGRKVIVNEADLHLYVAQWLLGNTTFRLSKSEAWQQADAFIKLMKERTGLLVDRGEKQFAFVHLTFQEYFAAAHICRNHLYDLGEIWKQIEPHLVDPTWREVNLLLMGKLNEFARMPSLVVERMLNFPAEDEQILYRVLSVATNCLVDNVRLDIPMQQRIIDKWIDILRSPLCNNQADMALEALNTIKKHSLVQERIQQVIVDKNEPTIVRLVLASLYVDNSIAPDWVFQALSNIVCDHNSSEETRWRALALIVNLKSQTNAIHELLRKIMSRNDANDSLTVCADLFIDPEYHSRFLVLFYSEDTTTQLLWGEEDCIRFIEADPTFAIIFGRMEWKEAWIYLIDYLQKINEPSELLKKLLRSHRGIEEKYIPEKYKEILTNILINIAKNVNLAPIGAETIHWFLKFNYPSEALFRLLLEIDALYDTDDWNLDLMSLFFKELFKRSDMNHELLLTWAEKVVGLQHGTFQISFIYALDGELAKELGMKIIKNLKNYDFICAILNNLYERSYLQIEDILPLLKQMLNQTESRWAKGWAAFHLNDNKLLDRQTALAIYVEVADQEDKNTSLKQSAGYQMAKLGAIDRGKQVLREVITGTQEDMEAKDKAFKALQEISAPNFYREISTSVTVF